MHQEGLISINNIIQAINFSKTGNILEYFYPEIIEEEPEAYLKEYRFRLQKIYSDEEITEFKEKRRKHFQWLRESGDFHDPFYSEIEQDQLRLSIKHDDISKFQTIISNLNISINSKISENVYERCTDLSDFSLIEFAVQFNAIKIFKFLVMNGAEINTHLVPFVIQQENYEMIHIVRDKLKTDFYQFSLAPSIRFWKMDILEFLIDNYYNVYMQKKEINEETRQSLLTVTACTFISENFIFFEMFLIPFFIEKSSFLIENLPIITSFTLYDLSCFFFKEFIKHPNLDVNSIFKENQCILKKAVNELNVEAVKILLKMPEIKFPEDGTSPFVIACCIDFNLEIVHHLYEFMVEKSVSYDLQQKMQTINHCGFYGNVNALYFLIDKFPEIIPVISKSLLSSGIVEKQFRVVKILLKKLCENRGYTEILNRIESEPTFECVKDEITFYTNIIYDIP